MIKRGVSFLAVFVIQAGNQLRPIVSGALAAYPVFMATRGGGRSKPFWASTFSFYNL